MDQVDISMRHPSVKEIMRFFDYDHLQDDRLKHISRYFNELAYELLSNLRDSPELTAGLRKLLEAKDCFVRAAL